MDVNGKCSKCKKMVDSYDLIHNAEYGLICVNCDMDYSAYGLNDVEDLYKVVKFESVC